MQLKEGTLLQGGKYKIERVLGQGGFGITYLGEQVALGRKVAIKEFFMKQLCNREAITSQVTMGTAGGGETVRRFREKFLKEARLIASCDNPHIVKIYDIFEDNGTAYYVMEYLEAKLHGDIGAISVETAFDIIRQIGEALIYIHNKNVLHLDVKPGNILFRNDTAKLIDYGISKRYNESGDETSTTPIGVSKGYAPIEQYNQGIQNFTPATDVYSLAATLYKLITGNTPPEASEIINDGLPTQELKFAKLNDETIAVIEKAMSFRVKDRYNTVVDFLSAIENAKDLNTGDRKQSTTSNKSKSQKDNSEEETIFQYEKTTKKEFSIDSNKHSEDKKTPYELNKQTDGIKWIIPSFIVVAVVIMGGIMLSQNNSANSTQTVYVEEDPDTMEISNFDFATSQGAPLLRYYKYSGTVVWDRQQKQYIPHGYGSAVISTGDSKGAKYIGQFKQGVFNGEGGKLTFKNGDVFEGSFNNGWFHYGTYRVKSSGEFFTGYFKDGKPSTGSWYDRNGKFIENAK